MSKKTDNDKKDEFKKYILELEQEIILNSDQVDSQQVVNRIVKHFDEVTKEEEANK